MKQKGNLEEKKEKKKKALLYCKSSSHAPLRKKPDIQVPGTCKCGFTVTRVLGLAVGVGWVSAHLGSEWEKLQVGNPAGVFIADFLSGRWHCFCLQ